MSEGPAFVVVKLHLDKLEFLLESGDLSGALVLVEGLLGDQLPSQILHLESVLPFDGLVFLTHDIAPNDVELVKDLGDAGFVHVLIEGLLNFSDLLHSFSRDPLVRILVLLLVSDRLSLVSLDPERVADVANALLAQVFCLSENLNIS